MKNRIGSVIVLTGLGALAYLGFTAAASSAQAPSAPTALERKVELLEKQVAALQKEIQELKQRPVVVTTLPLPNAPQAEPPPGTPFEFNGRTYYRVPLQKGTAADSGMIVAVPATPVAPAR